MNNHAGLTLTWPTGTTVVSGSREHIIRALVPDPLSVTTHEVVPGQWGYPPGPVKFCL